MVALPKKVEKAIETVSEYLKIDDFEKIPLNELTVSAKKAIPIEIAERYGRMAIVAMVCYGNRERAIHCIDRAFELATAERQKKITLDSPISQITSVRITTILDGHRIKTVGDLVTCTPERLCDMANIQKRLVEQLQESLKKHGFEMMKTEC
jgi:DNA-directed RNA polymerase alpha subunit